MIKIMVRSLVVVGLATMTAQAATITVNSTNDPAGFDPLITIGGLGGTVTLRDAVNAANNTAGDDVIIFDAALNGATVGMSNSFLSVTSTISIGAQAGMTVTVSRVAAGRHFFIATAGSLTVSNLVLANGVDGNGGSIQNDGILQVDLCIFTNNAAGNGGAIFNNTTGTAHLKATTIRNCFVNQTADGAGGAVFNFGGSFTAVDSTFAYNSKFLSSSIRGGGAFMILGGTVSFTNCTLAHNSSASRGGAVHLGSSSTNNLVNCTIASNTAVGSGPGISYSSSIPNARNTISQDGAYIGPGNVTASGLGTFGFHGGPTETFPLLPGSPAIGAGVYDPLVTNDQRGVARYNPPDSGAYELVPRQSLIVTTAVDEDDGTTDPSLGTGTSLREALTLAAALGGSQTVIFAPTFTNGGPVTISLTNALTLSGTVSIQGPGASWTTISGGGLHRVLFVPSGATGSISGLTIANGFIDDADVVDGSGAGIRCAGSLTVTDCAFTNNIAGGTNLGHGGAIYGHGTSLTVLRGTFIGNQAKTGGHGGGIHVASGSASIADSTITGNAASGHGGGMYHSGVSMYLSQCSIYNNATTSNGYGAGLAGISGTLMIDRSTFAYNVASNGNGGAIANFGATAGMTNSTLAFNSALNGGAIIHYGNPMTLEHCSVLYNTAVSTGGGIERVGRTGNPFNLKNTLVGGNNAPTGRDAYSYPDHNDGAFTSLGNNLIENGSGTIGLTNGLNGDQVGVAPRTGALQNYGGLTETIRLLDDSPAINAASGSVFVDQRGVSRPQGPAPDIGAYELEGIPPTGISGPTNATAYLSIPITPIQFTSGGTPEPILYVIGTLPSGVTITPEGLLFGTPATNTIGTYPVMIVASNGFPPHAILDFTLEVLPLNVATHPANLLAELSSLDGSLSISFTNITEAGFTAFAASDLMTPLNLWSNLGPATETPFGSGQYQFTDPDTNIHTQRYYHIQSP